MVRKILLWSTCNRIVKKTMLFGLFVLPVCMFLLLVYCVGRSGLMLTCSRHLLPSSFFTVDLSVILS